jgi:hypothetical protein
MFVMSTSTKFCDIALSAIFKRFPKLDTSIWYCAANFVAYYRVSTEKQGRSGLGPEAQQYAVETFIASKAGSKLVAPPFIEIESGKRNDRPELAKALLRAKVTGSTCSLPSLIG